MLKMRVCVVARVGGWGLDICNNKPENEPMFYYRQAQSRDLDLICRFTDFWLSGRGKSKGISGVVDDCFISKGQHQKYILRYATLLVFDGDVLVGWAVVEPSDTLIHMLVAGNYRRKGIGRRMVQILRPKRVRSKSDQSSGNPIGFYKKLGYRVVNRVQSRSRLDIDSIRPSRKSNIDVLVL